MKKLLLATACLCVLGATAGFAQTDPVVVSAPTDQPMIASMPTQIDHLAMAGGLGEINNDEFAEKLNLTEEQRNQVKALVAESNEKIRPLDESRKEINEKIRSIRDANMSQLEQILSSEQLQYFHEHRYEFKPYAVMKDKPVIVAPEVASVQNNAPVAPQAN